MRYDAEHGKWLSRSTVSRMVQGTVVCRRYEQIEAFVAACGAEEYTEVWVSAWARVRDNQRTSGHTLRDRAFLGAGPPWSIHAHTVDEMTQGPPVVGA